MEFLPLDAVFTCRFGFFVVSIGAIKTGKETGIFMRKVLVIHGPNLNLLGEREPNVYGSVTLEEINKALQEQANESDIELRTVQSNHEGEIVETIQNSRHSADVIIINPPAYTHTSVAIRH